MLLLAHGKETESSTDIITLVVIVVGIGFGTNRID
jgi:hypothetical protein